MKYHITLQEAIAQLQKETAQPFTVLLQRGSLQIEFFAPKIKDNQQPHQQDELYLIASGSSRFYRAGEVVDVQAGDFLFVPAGMEHHFENFSDDFATWVVFYGPVGGEKE